MTVQVPSPCSTRRQRQTCRPLATCRLTISLPSWHPFPLDSFLPLTSLSLLLSGDLDLYLLSYPSSLFTGCERYNPLYSSPSTSSLFTGRERCISLSSSPSTSSLFTHRERCNSLSSSPSTSSLFTGRERCNSLSSSPSTSSAVATPFLSSA